MGWGNPPVATRTVTDAIVTDRVRDLVWTVDHAGVRRMTPEGLYGRRKMTALVKRADADASPGSVDRAMRALGLQGVGPYPRILDTGCDYAAVGSVAARRAS